MFKRVTRLDLLLGSLGLLILVSYWWSIGGASIPLSAGADSCFDFLRQEVAQQLKSHHWVTFWTQSFMAPTGIWMPFASWTIERDLIGGLYWLWKPGAPFVGGYFLVSLVVSYLLVGGILRKISIGPIAAWGLATFFLLLNPARHLKAWHHFEFLPQHWLYLGYFLDVWIWNKILKEKTWSLQLEAWRVFALLGNLFSTGYFWSIGLIEFFCVRLGILLLFFTVKFSLKVAVPKFREWIIPGFGSVVLFVIDLAWFVPLYQATRHFPLNSDFYGYASKYPSVFAPLFLPLERLGISETLVAAGWSYWIPVLLGVLAVWKRKGLRGGLTTLAPFLMVLIIGCSYITRRPDFLALFMKNYFPFMKFFRVASRWGLFLPLILASLLSLCWIDLKAVFQKLSLGIKTLISILFLGLLFFELRFLLQPVNMWAPLDGSVSKFLKAIKEKPGERILDLPFCVAGGNGACAEQQCPNYPGSVETQCFRLWHEKQVYGLYLARLNPEACEIYNRAPFQSWFSAWKEKRCFQGEEWKDFCNYLDENERSPHGGSSLAGILLHTNVWRAAGSLSCLAQFENYLGQPTLSVGPGGEGQLLFFEPRCVKR